MTRIKYDPFKTTPWESRDNLVLRGRKGSERIIKQGKWWINRNTPVGEDAEYWESKPYGGKRLISRKEIIAFETP